MANQSNQLNKVLTSQEDNSIDALSSTSPKKKTIISSPSESANVSSAITHVVHQPSTTNVNIENVGQQMMKDNETKASNGRATNKTIINKTSNFEEQTAVGYPMTDSGGGGSSGGRSSSSSSSSSNNNSGTETEEPDTDNLMILVTAGGHYDDVFEIDPTLSNDNINSLAKKTAKKQTRQVKTSASSSASSGSSLSIALPPITYGELNKNRYIMESITFFDSFFGPNEMERYFPDHKLRLAIISWNMSSKAPANYDQALQQMLKLKATDSIVDENTVGLESETLPEMFVIGLQETPKSEVIINNIKVGIQAVLGPNYVLLNWYSIGALHASIWLRRELLWSCTIVDMVPVHLRPTAANRIRTKGAISLSFSLFGTSFLFINTHLSAHETNLRTRINQLDKVQQALNIGSNSKQKISNSTSKAKNSNAEEFKSKKKRAEIMIKNANSKLNRQSKDSSRSSLRKRIKQQTEYIFWFGDLNFRLELPIDDVLNIMQSIANTNNADKKLKHQKELMKSDQLSNLMSRNLIFDGFQEALWPPPFFPTYKCRIDTKEMINVNKKSPQSYDNRENDKQRQQQQQQQSSDKPNSSTSSKTQLSTSETNTFSSMSPTSFSSSKQSNEVDNGSIKQSLSANSTSSRTSAVAGKKQSYEELISIYDFDSHRVPSYTDRILFQSKPISNDKNDNSQSLVCLQYDSINDIGSSDHKPIYALFEVKLKSGGPRIPLRLKQMMSVNEVNKSRRRLPIDNSFDNHDQTKASIKNYSIFGRRFVRKARLAEKLKPTTSSTNLTAIGNNSLSASLSSLSSLTNTGKGVFNSTLDKLARLNAGAFDRQVFIEGLRLRSTMLHTITIDQMKQRNNALFKSYSFDLNISEQSLPHTSGVPISPLVTKDEISKHNRLKPNNNNNNNNNPSTIAMNNDQLNSKASSVCLIS